MDAAGTIKGLAGLRVVIGVTAWLFPKLAGRLFGLDPGGNPQAPYLARLFGVRDVALGLGALGTEGEARRRWLMAGLGCDLADAAAGMAGGRRGYLSPLTTVMVTGTALAAAGLGAKALSPGERPA
ncbi:MAG: hypothetical protein E6G56_11165 [Actinobacteria bacterium]|nr:MAG: hypothetical protein E6G56_11165 [Actinomycetota bacterium]